MTSTASPHAQAALQSDFTFSHQPSNRTGVTMSASREGNIIAQVMAKKPNVTVSYFPALIRIDAERMMEFDLPEIAEALGIAEGEEYGPYQFEVEMSTHYGRMVRLDDKVLMFANPEDAAEYLGFVPAEAES